MANTKHYYSLFAAIKSCLLNVPAIHFDKETDENPNFQTMDYLEHRTIWSSMQFYRLVMLEKLKTSSRLRLFSILRKTMHENWTT